MSESERGNRKERTGVVVSNKMAKTIAVQIDRSYAHPLYKKATTRSKKFYADDPKNECNIGDLVRIRETRPLSKLKRWELVEIVKRAD
jgi:small subunit ribosomal protein S17